jgi:hypothetical protein
VEIRFKQLQKLAPEESARMVAEADRKFKAKYALLTKMAAMYEPEKA